MLFFKNNFASSLNLFVHIYFFINFRYQQISFSSNFLIDYFSNMGIENLYIARVTDGLILVASMEHGSSSTEKMELFKNQAKQLLKKLNARSAAKMSIESNPYVFQ